jgi:hypothetical protein
MAAAQQLIKQLTEENDQLRNALNRTTSDLKYAQDETKAAASISAGNAAELTAGKRAAKAARHLVAEQRGALKQAATWEGDLESLQASIRTYLAARRGSKPEGVEQIEDNIAALGGEVRG